VALHDPQHGGESDPLSGEFTRRVQSLEGVEQLGEIGDVESAASPPAAE